MSTVTIPLAMKSDVTTLMSFALEAFARSKDLYGHIPPDLDSLNWHNEQIEGGFYHSILLDDELVGGIVVQPHPDNAMKIDYFYIGTAFQGKKIGQSVMVLLEELYTDVKKWFLSTPYKDYGNHYFYEKHGYIKVGEMKPMEGNEFTLFMYEKQM